jgi:4-hydroxy-2-oxoheptanedioate aldolase
LALALLAHCRCRTPVPRACAAYRYYIHMRPNRVKVALATPGETVVGTWLTLGDELSPRVLCRAGFDFLALDAEHAAVDWSRAASIFAHVADAGCVPLCRVADGSTENIKRALDAGAFGIICPMIDSAAQARAILDAAYYPPRGRRSVGPGAHFLNFGTSDATYKARANDAIAVILMAESPEGVSSAREWCELEGVDAVFVGPADLRAQLSRALPGGRAPTDAEFEDSVATVRAAGADAGCATGIHAFTAADARARLAQGFRFITVGSDVALLSAAAAEMVSAVGGGGGGGGRSDGGEAPRVLGGAGAY